MMSRACLLVLLFTLAAGSARAQFHTPRDSTDADTTMTDAAFVDAYRIYHADGTPATFDDVVDALSAVDVVFFGEEHDDPVTHYLQARLLGQAYVRYGTPSDTAHRPMALSLEMFERDVQPILNEYLAGLITERHFLRSARPWDNYESDYAPMVAFAKAHDLPVLAANAPRRYVNRVTRLGPEALDSLSTWAKTWLPPLPYPPPSPAYEAAWDAQMAEMMEEMAAEEHADSTAADSMMHAAEMPAAEHPHAAPSDSIAAHPMPHATDPHAAPPDSMHVAVKHVVEHVEDEPASPHDAPPEDDEDSDLHGGSHLLAAQALWDATMAHTLATYLNATPDALVLHLAGGFHVEAGLGTPAQLDAYRPAVRSLIVVAQAVDDINIFDAEALGDLGDFVILTDKSLPRTF